MAQYLSLRLSSKLYGIGENHCQSSIDAPLLNVRMCLDIHYKARHRWENQENKNIADYYYISNSDIFDCVG